MRKTGCVIAPQNGTFGCRRCVMKGRIKISFLILIFAVSLGLASCDRDNIGSAGLPSEKSTGDITVTVNRNTDATNIVNALADVIESVKDSVVEVRTQTETTGFFGNTTIESGAGSAVIYSVSDSDILLLTCYHVVENVDTVTVKLTDGSEHAADVKAYDAVTDLAIIAISPESIDTRVFRAVRFDSEDDGVQLAEKVLAIGNPLGSLGGTVTCGFVSAVSRTLTVNGAQQQYIQTDASINGGNSGGALFDTDGDLIGIVNAKYT
ncbi:MAG: S1C family serine protease, partial [Christensenellales bacterium]